MRPIRYLALASVAFVWSATSVSVLADDFGHEYFIGLSTGDVTSGKSGFGQGVAYAFYPVRVDTGDKPYGEAAFITQAHYVAVSIDGSSADSGAGSAHDWQYAVRGRYTLPGNIWFGEAEFVRNEYEFNPFVLSEASGVDSLTNLLRVRGGMYLTPTTSVDLGLAYSSSENSFFGDETTSYIDIHGRTLLPAGNQYVAAELRITHASTDADNYSQTSLDYKAKLNWYFTHKLDAGISYETGIDPDYALADYRTFGVEGNWFLEPELLISVRAQRQTWWNDDQFDLLLVRLGVRL